MYFQYLKRVIHDQLIDFFSKLFNHCFRQLGHVLVDKQHLIRMEKSYVRIQIYCCNLTSAFDFLQHDLLLLTQEAYGLCQTML